jgi:hypothetical protein
MRTPFRSTGAAALALAVLALACFAPSDGDGSGDTTAAADASSETPTTSASASADESSADATDGATDATDDGTDDGDDTGNPGGPPGAPVLLFTDLTSGPSRGWQGGDTHGAAVTVFGHNFGDVRGDATIVIGGVELVDDADYLAWGDPARVPGLQRATFLVPAGVADGDVEIALVDGETTSNSLPFTVREGAIRHVETTGDDAADGSAASPWATVQHAANSLAPGDIAYLGDGVAATQESDFTAVVNLPRSGAAGGPIALVAMPGADVQVGNPAVSRGFHNWGIDRNGYTGHWVIAGLRITAGETCLPLGEGSRAVGNELTAPQGNGQQGCIYSDGSHVAVLGNELHDVGAPDCSKLYHTVYLTGPRTDDPPRLPTVVDREVAWNWFHDNDANRAINAYSEQAYSAFVEGIHVHHNLVVDQRGDGIMLGYYVTGDNRIHDNVIVRAGLGPEWVDDISSHAGIRLYPGHEEAPATVHLVHNTVVDSGYARAIEASGNLLVDDALATLEIRNNVFVAGSEPNVVDGSVELPAGAWTNLWSGDAPAWDGAAISGEPGFVDAAGLDFHLAQGSPAVDAGDPSALEVAPADMDGVVRPQGAAPDLGAFEYVGR